MDGITFTGRGLSERLAPAPGVKLRVERLEWRAVGGPWTARMRADSSSLARLWGLVDLLRCGVVVSDAAAIRSGPGAGRPGQQRAAVDAAWWGYVSAVELHTGARVARIGLDEMSNKIAVRYRPAGPLGPAAAERVTGWRTDSESVKLYGEKEKVFTIGEASAGDAVAYAYAMLSEVGKPKLRAGIDPAAAGGGYWAVIEARGWWETLGWRYYHETRGKVELLNGAGVQNLGSASVNRRAAYSFSLGAASWKASEVWLWMKRTAAVSDNVIVELCANDGGVPGTVLASKTQAGNALADSLTWTQFELDAPASLAANTTYWIVVRRSGTESSSSHYTLVVDEGLSGAGSLLLYDGYNWSPRDPDADLSFTVLGVEETTTQITAMLASSAGGQFLSGARISTASGVDGRLFRDGRRNARVEVETLLRLGTAAGRRLLAWVDAGRRVDVYGMPEESSAGLVIGEDGRIERPDGRALALSEQPAGKWARLGGLSTAGVLMGYAGAVFIERAVWDGRVLRYGE